MTRVVLLLAWACAAVCGAACSSNAPAHCYYQDETICIDLVVPEGAGPGPLSFSDAGAPDCAACLTTYCAVAAQGCDLTDAGAVSCVPSDPAFAALSSCLTASCASSCPDGVP